jgi:hypothetical protein
MLKNNFNFSDAFIEQIIWGGKNEKRIELWMLD